MVPQSYINEFAPKAKRRVVLAGKRLAYMIEQVYGDGYKDEDIDIIEKIDPTRHSSGIGGFLAFLLILTSVAILCAILNNKYGEKSCLTKCSETFVAIKIFVTSIYNIWRS